MQLDINPRTQALHAAGQSLWVDNVDRRRLDDGTLARQIAELSVTGLTSNPTIFEQAMAAGDAYDAQIREAAARGVEGEELFFALAVRDLTRAADLFRPIHAATDGSDGWVSLEVSPRLADDTRRTTEAAIRLHALAARPNLYIKIPGTPAGVQAIEDAVFAGVPINVTLLFSAGQVRVVADAVLRAIERRLGAGLDPRVESVASLFVSRWDAAVHDRVGPELRNRLGIAMAQRAYAAWCELLESPRWRRLADAGARPQRLLFASTGTKDPAAADTLYVEALAAPGTVDTMPDKTLTAFADHGKVGALLARASGAADATLAAFAAQGIDVDALAGQLQREAAEAFVASWTSLLAGLREKSAKLVPAAAAWVT